MFSGADPLLCLLYETDSGSSEKTESTQIQDIARVWRYRTPISWQHLVQEVNTRVGTEHGTHQQHKILQLFIEDVWSFLFCPLSKFKKCLVSSMYLRQVSLHFIGHKV